MVQWLHLSAWAWLSMSCIGCSHIRQTYVMRGYDAHAQAAIKHIAVVAWAPSDHNDLAPVLAAVATDLVKLRKNYLVLNHAAQAVAWPHGCTEHAEGLLLLRALDVDGPKDKHVALDIGLELYRCYDGALIFRARAKTRGLCQQKALTDLEANYEATLGPAAKTYAAPAFSVLQELVEALPDPKLTDDEIGEKIELGRPTLLKLDSKPDIDVASNL